MDRLGRLAGAGAFTVYAWAFLPNHSHLLVCAGGLPVARWIRSLLTRYGGAFYRCHDRSGQLFQDR